MKLTPIEWNRVRTDWEFKNMTFSEISNKYHISRATISKRKNKEGWDRVYVQQLQERRVKLLIELKALDGALYRHCWDD